MNRALLDVIFASEKRKNMLLMLNNGPVSVPSLLSALKTTRQSLLPQAKVLEENKLIEKNDDNYELTSIGETIVSRLLPVMAAVNVLEEDIDYWGTHDLDFIPDSLFQRLDELCPCMIIEPSISNVFELNRDFVETSLDSRSFYSFVSFLHPEYIQIFLDRLYKDADTSFIASESLFEKIRSDYYDDFMELLSRRSAEFYVYSGEMGIVSFSQNDHCFVLRLLTKNREHDSKQLICKSPLALEWGKEFFEYYKQRSVPVSSF